MLQRKKNKGEDTNAREGKKLRSKKRERRCQGRRNEEVWKKKRAAWRRSRNEKEETRFNARSGSFCFVQIEYQKEGFRVVCQMILLS